jgi:hypothetical protein
MKIFQLLKKNKKLSFKIINNKFSKNLFKLKDSTTQINNFYKRGNTNPLDEINLLQNQYIIIIIK